MVISGVFVGVGVNFVVVVVGGGGDGGVSSLW